MPSRQPNITAIGRGEVGNLPHLPTAHQTEVNREANVELSRLAPQARDPRSCPAVGPHEPHPLFVDFVRAALERRRARLGHDDYTASDREAAARAAREEPGEDAAPEQAGRVPRHA